MKKLLLFCSMLLLFVLMAGCKSSPSAPGNEEESTASQVSTPAPPPAPTQGKPNYSHLRPWTFNPEREVPTKADFTVKVEGTQVKKKVFLYGVYAEQNFIADSAFSKPDGSVNFKKENGYLSGLYYVGVTDKLFLQILLDKDQVFQLTTSADKPFENMKVKGNIDTELLYEANKFDRVLQPQFDVVNKRVADAKFGSEEWKKAKAEQRELLDRRANNINGYKTKHPEAFYPLFKIAGQNPNIDPPYLADGSIDQDKYVPMYRAAFWDGVDFGDVRLLRTPVFHNKLKRYMQELTPQGTDSLTKSAKIVAEKAVHGHPEVFKHVVNWLAINYNEKGPVMGAEKVFVNLVNEYFTNDLAYWTDTLELEKIRDKAVEMQNSLLGMKGMDVTASDYNDVSHSLYDIKDSMIVLFIYSTECDHCKEASPEIEKLNKQWKGTGKVGFFGICIDKDKDEFRRFAESYGFSFPNVYDPQYKSQYYLKYHMDITPEIYILDQNRIIVGKNLQPEQVNEIIERHL
jgi:peroxiredoxin